MVEATVSGQAGTPEPKGSGVPALLRLETLSKQFPGTLALDRVNFDMRPGEVHVLFGENGAGKSTLIKIVAGVQKPTGGKIYFRGKPIDLNSVHHARKLGVSAVFQEFSLIPQLTVEENLFLGREVVFGGLLNKAHLHRQARDILGRLGFPLRPQDRVMYLSRAEQQMVEIAKAFCTEPAIMIFDEPTSSLTERETERLFTLIRKIKRQGIGVIYITHRMNEIKRIADRITVLRDGRYIATLDVAEATDEKLVELMTGRVITQIFPEIKFQPGETLLKIENLSTADRTVSNVSINVRAGEVVGLAGLVGSGKSQVGRACFGLEKVAAGTIIFMGEDVTGLGPRAMLNRGLYYLPSDRCAEGLVMLQNVRENVALPSLGLSAFSNALFLRRRSERALVKDLARKLNLVPLNVERNLEHFSGGNQQKVLVGKALAREVKLFVFHEPTVGVDVGARVSIYQFIRDLCEAGAGVLLISSDLPEILHIPSRAYVMHRGQLRAELHGDEITEDAVLGHFYEKKAAA